MTDYYYTESHEWVAEIDGEWRVGITDHAQEELGDITFVDLPEPGEELNQGDPFGTIESVKTVSELYSPVSGEVESINQAVEDSPELINTDPETEGWLISVSGLDQSELGNLMDEEEYDNYLGQ